MSYTISPEDTSWDPNPEQQSSHSSRLLMVVAGAVLFVLGITIGGLMAKPHAPAPSEPAYDELASLRAKIDLLTMQAAESKVRSTELEQLLVSQQTQLSHEREVARLTHQRMSFIEQAINANHANRDLCLSELEQLQDQPKGVPTTQVIQFVDAIFECNSRTLNTLRSDAPVLTADLELQESLNAVRLAATQHSAKHRRASVSSEPTLAEPTLAAPPVTRTARQGVFFSAPPRRVQGVTFISPRPSSHVASQQNTGMRFVDESSSEAGPSFR
ncbi:MAG: hypothetical protein KDA93_22335 [Planctomycetaceae bacterium]|nr:hypothetical protein [Planctomycetaceae bacterium]